MQAIRSYLRQVSILMAFAMMMTTLWAVPASAAMVGTGEVLTEQRADIDRASLMTMLEKQEVKDVLASMGVSEAEVENRIQSLTPAELADFEQQLATAPTGEGVVGVIVLFLVIFIVTDLLCATNIYPFINCIR